MASHRIVCDNQEPVSQPKSHAHIVQVGIAGSEPNTYSRLLTLGQVLQWMARGETFYTKSPSTDRIAEVVSAACATCNHRIIRSAADAIHDNNLDHLPDCT